MAFIGMHQGDLPIVKNSFRREGRRNISMILKYVLVKGQCNKFGNRVYLVCRDMTK
jgi:hypothetical protein